jgi:hypothetical protein
MDDRQRQWKLPFLVYGTKTWTMGWTMGMKSVNNQNLLSLILMQVSTSAKPSKRRRSIGPKKLNCEVGTV